MLDKNLILMQFAEKLHAHLMEKAREESRLGRRDDLSKKEKWMTLCGYYNGVDDAISFLAETETLGDDVINHMVSDVREALRMDDYQHED